ncbi:MAG: hypothetical protein IJW76_05530 [Clostridia bacterium]|nr:hypothetical protein [Clostridia bacterium]MBQ8862525.1 hypothetical protein [Clostridia bacterium]
MKKIIALALVLTLCLVLFCSCGINGEYEFDSNIYWTSNFMFLMKSSDFYIESKDGNLTLNTKRQGSSGYDYIGYEISCVGVLTRFWLTSSNFDDMISDGMWQDGFSAEQIRIETKEAWKVMDGDELKAYFLLQSDGSALYVSIDDGVCNRIVKLNKVDKKF